MKRTPRSADDEQRSIHRQLLEQPAPGPDFTLLIEARDFLRVMLPKLTEKQRTAVVAWAGGMTCSEIAAAERVTPEAVHARLSSGLRRLRQLGGEDS